MKIRQFKSASLRRFEEAIGCISREEVLEENEDVSITFDKFLNVLSPVYDSCYPTKIMKKRKKEPKKNPWINVAIIDKMEEEKKLYLFYLESNAQEDLGRFERGMDLMNSLMRSTL